jgi:hypothetical protein
MLIKNKWNMLPARLADHQTPNLTRERTDCTLSPATPVVPDDPSPQSKPVSLPKSAREEDSRVRGLGDGWTWHYESSQMGNGSILSNALGIWTCFCIGGPTKRIT